MQKLITAIILAISIISCSQDEEAAMSAKDGQYLFQNDTCTVNINLESGKMVHIWIFKNNKFVLQQLYQNGISTQGEYPNYIYEVSPIDGDPNKAIIRASFSSPTTFEATVEGSFGCSSKNIAVPLHMTFGRSDKVLDENGDGILDEAQP